MRRGTKEGAKKSLSVRREFLRQHRELLYFLSPLTLVVFLLILLPVAGTFRDSLYLDVTFLPRRFLGLENYAALLRDPAFLSSLRFTLLFVFFSVPLEVALGFGVALVMNESFPGRGVVRSLLLLPWAIPATVSARTFQLVYNYGYGAANELLVLVGANPVHWTGTETGALLALLLADSWKTTPFVAILLLAGLASIPEQLYQQAKIDRAGPFRRFFFLTLPLLRPVLTVTVLFRSIEALRVFDVIYVLTGGGPGGSTTSLSMLGYDFFSGGDFGYGSTVSVVLFLAALALSLLYVRPGAAGGEP